MYLADTNVISESDPTKVKNLKSYRSELSSSNIYISTVTVAEILYGIELLNQKGSTAKAARFGAWWEQVERLYAGRILEFDVSAARAAAVIAAHATMSGHDPEWPDIQIAAIARVHGLTVLTRNVRHFAPLLVSFIDPFAPS